MTGFSRAAFLNLAMQEAQSGILISRVLGPEGMASGFDHSESCDRCNVKGVNINLDQSPEGESSH
jgi:hypothetical protein